MAKDDKKFDTSSSKPTDQEHRPPTYRELLGLGVWMGDRTGNQEHNNVPSRTNLPGRGDPADSLDRFSPEAQPLEYDFYDDEEDEMSEALPESQPQASIAANSLTNLHRDTPSIKSSTARFTFQGGSKK